ncbi:hypothetical protein ACHAQA_008788 [Verticillium albo-atrum]
MAEAAIGLSAGIVDLADTIFGLIKRVREATQRVEGHSKSLDNVSSQLATLETSVDLVRDESSLHTPLVESQLQAAELVADDLRDHVDRLAAVGKLAIGDEEEAQLEAILKRLDQATDSLQLQISVVQVGLLGNLQEGFCVAFPLLERTNNKVQQLLGFNLALMKLVESRMVLAGTRLPIARDASS